VKVTIVESDRYTRALGRDAIEGELCAQERERARRLMFDEDRVSYLAAHHLLRTMLSQELGVAPSAIVLRAGAGGRPELAVPAAPISFNISHTRGMVGCALSAQATVGIDVEWDRPIGDVDALARSVMGPGELARLRAVAPGERRRAFLRAWTAKEAYAKALGLGLSLDWTTVELDERDGAIRRATAGQPLPGVRLRFCDAGPAHVAAVATITPEGAQ
jgi:4'-phosphopantetheinyl transferase